MAVADRFTREQRDRVAQAVKEAEATTAAEIVPVVAAASGRYDRAEDVAGLWLGLILLTATWLFWPAPASEVGDWGAMPRIYELAALVVSVVIGFFIGAVLTARVAMIRRLFASQVEMRDEVAARARSLFFDNRVHHTAGATGLLIYVSLFEHKAAVLADQGVLDKLGGAAVEELCAQLTAELKKGDLTAALCNVIKAAGTRLAAVLPRQADDVNELADALVMID